MPPRPSGTTGEPEEPREGSQGADVAAGLSAAWWREIIASLGDGVVVLDQDGTVLEVNQAFTELLGYGPDDGPLRPPYPWWATPEEDPEAHEAVRRAFSEVERSGQVNTELLLYNRDRKPVWVRTTGVTVPGPEGTARLHLRTVRDITRARAAQERRTAAAQVSADFSASDDLGALIGVAKHGFELLFDGACTIQLTFGDRAVFFVRGRSVDGDELDAPTRRGLAGQPSPDTVSLRPGILLVASASTQCRAWVQFPQPRRIGPDEMIVADLLAQAFALAVDRLVSSQEAADREAGLVQALGSHRVIGQAVGILVERYRLLPGEAFDRLRRASQNRNLKIRDLAARVIETGADPETA